MVYYTLEAAPATKAAADSPKVVIHHSPSFVSSMGAVTASDTGSELASASDCDGETADSATAAKQLAALTV